MSEYIVGIDQSTQGTKALVFDSDGILIERSDCLHRQIVNEKGWVEHDPEEIYANTILAVKQAVKKAGINKKEIRGVGISNQRETSLAWDKKGRPIYNAIVWQCARAEDICQRVSRKSVDGKSADEYIKETSGIPNSPYFPAAKISWLLKNVEGAMELADKGKICYGTIDSFLVYRLTKGMEYRTDYSNASRTQLFSLKELSWDKKLCDLFDVPMKNLPEITDSNGFFGETDFEGWLDHPIPIHSVLGDSHGALFGQGCIRPGMVKATYGTGSSVMMNIGGYPIASKKGLISTIAWSMDGKVTYALEGNINYTGAVITWLKDNLCLIKSPNETSDMAKKANPEDNCYLIPAFTGLGSPWWDSEARAQITNMSRTTGKNEIIRAALDCTAYQIADVIRAMEEDAGIQIHGLYTDGGATKNNYLMNFQSGILGMDVFVSDSEELSGIGAAYAAGIGTGLYKNDLADQNHHTLYSMNMGKEKQKMLLEGWGKAVHSVLNY